MRQRDPIDVLGDYYRALHDMPLPDLTPRPSPGPLVQRVWQPLGGIALGMAATAALVIWVASTPVEAGTNSGSPILRHQFQSAGLTERDLPVVPKRAEARGSWGA